MIVMDKHEKSEITRLVERACDKVDYWDDFGGDYAVGGNLIERKRWEEVAGRMMETDRHLYYQLDKLVTAADAMDLRPCLLLEGDMGAEFEHTDLPRDRVSEYLAGVTVMDIHTIVSTSRRSTAKILHRLEDQNAPDVRRVRGAPPSTEEQPRYVLEGIEGLGPSTAEGVLDRFGNVKSVALATPAELEEVPGVGEKTAERIREAFDADYQ